jgi:signal transduction histidine kinase
MAVGSEALRRPSRGDVVLGIALSVAAATAAWGAPGSWRPLLILFAGSAGLSLALRCVYPLTVFMITIVATGFFAAVYDAYWPFAAVVAFYSLGTHTGRRTALTVGTAGMVALAIPIATQIDWTPFTWSKVMLEIGRLAPLAAAWILGDNMHTRRAYLHAVEERAAQLEREQEANARRAAAEEQARIAREVHDVVAHNLSVIIVQATAADEVFTSDPDDAHEAVRTIGSTARRALDELRQVLGSGEESGLAPQPTLNRLDGLLEQVRAAGLAVELEVIGEQPELPPALELSAYRIVQEALTNTLRHAGAAHAVVRLHFDPGAVTIDVHDDGSVPSANGGNGRGLIGMRERVSTFGGRLETGPETGGGFRVTATLPVAEARR